MDKENNFFEEINELERLEFEGDFTILKGNLPILFSAPHAVEHIREDGSLKYGETYTKAISIYLNKYFNAYSIFKNRDNGIDSNRDNYDEYNVEMRRLIKENNIKIVIDLHGADRNRDFDVEFGTMNNLTATFSTIKELEEAFTENGIPNIEYNSPFKGGAITKGVFSLTDVDVVQLEINGRLRDYNHLENLELLINALGKFIEQYKEYMNR